MYRSGLSTWEEVEANHLAADILMPRALLASYIAQWGVDAAVLAPFFKVSRAAMQIRLKP
jgi:Zn-dependent peptidase ImmA (M78 family)